MVPVVQPALVVRDGDVLRPEVVGDGDDAIDEGEHQVVPRLGAVHPQQNGVPRAGDEGEGQAVRLNRKSERKSSRMKNFIAVTFDRER